MVKKLLVIVFASCLILPAYAVEYSNFAPIGSITPNVLSKTSTEIRPLPMLLFFDKVIPEPTDDPDTLNIQSGLIFDDIPINEVYLDKNIVKPSIILPSNMFNSPIIDSQSSNAISSRSVFNRNVCIGESSRSAADISGYAYEKTGNITFGAGYNRGLDKSQMEDNARLFTRYENNRFAINSQYIASSKQDLGTQSNSFKISPEIKLNNQFRVRTGFQSYTNVPLKKGEVVLVYSPSVRKYLDSLNFEFGVVQRYNTATGTSGSEIKFSTGFRL